MLKDIRENPKFIEAGTLQVHKKENFQLRIKIAKDVIHGKGN
ncbi:MAG: hypothetical protein OEV44_15050 [Spirochaetota bacterium]|nr:hypothetical protein [Spirochaetota bacterium]